MVYDHFQKKAIDYIKEGHSVIVSAPTGAGKTVIAEYVINDCLQNRKKAIYTAPIKALSNQKFRDFQGTFKDRVGILTGDVNINPDADILIMTTEIFRNKLLENTQGLKGYSWIIFDEIHYLDDHERGTTWEESLIFMPDHIKVLGLSATIPNVGELSKWLIHVHKMPIKVVTEDKRPVPLHFFYQYEGQIIDNLHKARPRSHKRKPSRPTTLIRHLFDKERLPCIYFSFGRRRCEHLAEEMMQFSFLNADEKREIVALYKDLCDKFGLTSEKSAYMMKPLIERGIAFHHAGMLPTLKEVIERLFTSRLIKVIFTTETFALGINMPARTVVFDELRKYYGGYFANLRVRDFYQMAGRAGRRGIDKEGFVYSRINPRYMSFHDLKAIIYGQPGKVMSRFNASYATLLNLYKRYGEDLYDIYNLSFHSYQQKSNSKKRALNMLHSKMSLLKEFGHIKEGSITEKGDFASKLYGYEMPLSEFYEKGILQRLSERQLGIISLALVFEPRKGSHSPRLDRKTRSLINTTEGITGHIHKRERSSRVVPLSKRCMYHLTPALEAWMDGAKFDRILRYTDADEGQIIRNFRMAIQILREELDTPAGSELKSRAYKAITLINRDIVDAERQLRE